MADLKWDHTVHYVNDLDEAVKKFRDKGLFAFPGGSHQQWGTANALSYFDLNYIEFLSVEDRERAAQVTDPNDVVKDAVKLLPENESLSRVALRTDNIEAIAEQLSKTDLVLSPIMDGKRHDVQGNLIEWRMLTIAGGFHGVPYPFIIQWNESDDQRRKKLTETGVIKEHTAGDVVIDHAAFHVDDPALVAYHWAELFDLPVADAEDSYSKVVLRVDDYHFVFKKGDKNGLSQIVFDSESPELKEERLVIGGGEYIF